MRDINKPHRTMDDILGSLQKLRKYTPAVVEKQKQAARSPANMLRRNQLLANYGINLEKYHKLFDPYHGRK